MTYINKKTIKCLDYNSFMIELSLFSNVFCNTVNVVFKKSKINLNASFKIENEVNTELIKEYATKDWFNKELFPYGIFVVEKNFEYIEFSSKNKKTSKDGTELYIKLSIKRLENNCFSINYLG